MRTTLTLDDDVAVQIDRLRQGRRASLKDIVNEAMRLGLRAMDEPPRTRRPFQTRAFSCGKPLIPNIDNTAEVLAIIEGEDYK